MQTFNRLSRCLETNFLFADQPSTLEYYSKGWLWCWKTWLAYRCSKNQEKCVPVMVTKDFFVCVCLSVWKFWNTGVGYSSLLFGIILVYTVCILAISPVSCFLFYLYLLWKLILQTCRHKTSTVQCEVSATKSDTLSEYLGTKALFQSTVTFSSRQTLSHLSSINPSMSQWRITTRRPWIQCRNVFRWLALKPFQDFGASDGIKQ